MISSIDINNLIECLQITYTSTDNEEREKAEQTLRSYESNIILYTKLLLESILPDRRLDMKIKVSIILQLKRAIIMYIESNKDYNIGQIIEIIKIYIGILIKPNIEEKLLENIGESFKLLLNVTETTPKTLIDLSTTLCISLNSNSIPLESYKGIITVLSSMIQCEAFTIDNDIQVLIQIIPLVKRLLEMIHTNLQQVTIDNNKEKYLFYTKVIGEFYALFFNCKPKKALNKKLKEFLMISFKEFIPFGVKMVFDVIPNYVPNPPICWTKEKEIDNCINLKNYKIIRFFGLMIKYLPDFIDDTTIINIHIEIIKMISINLEYVIVNKYNDLIQINSQNNFKYSNIISQMIIYLNISFGKSTFRNEFEPFSNNFFKNIILPFLIITQSEIDQSIKDPNTYSVIVNDIIFNNLSKNIKSSMSLLLKNFKTIKNEQFICDYIFELMDTVLKNNSNSNDNNQITHLLTPNDYIVKINPSNEERLDLCLLVFLILQKQLKNKKIEITFCDKIKDHLDVLFSDNAQPFIKHKICIILNQFYHVFVSIDMANKSNSISTIYFIRYLYKNIISDSNSLVTNESVDSLKRIIKSINIENSSDHQVMLDLLVEIIKIIPKTNIPQIFEILYQIKLKMNNTLYDSELFKLLINRISIEAAQQHRLKKKQTPSSERKNNSEISQTIPERKVNHNTIIIDCFNIIKVMINKNNFVLMNSKIIEEGLTPLIFYIKTPTKIVFDSDIIIVMTKLIKETNTLPEVALSLIPELHKYANKGMTDDLYKLVNLYLIHGNDIIGQNDIYIKGISNILTKKTIDSTQNISSYYTHLLIHVWLMNNNNIQFELVNLFVSEAIKTLTRINSKLSQKTVYSLFNQYTFIFNLLIIYSAFIYYPTICIELINKNNQMFEFFQWSDKLSQLPIYFYPIKMIILSLCLLINSTFFSKDDLKFLNLSLKYLELLKEYESAKIIKNSKIKVDFMKEEDHDDNELDDSDDEPIMSDYEDRDSDETESDDSDNEIISNTDKEIEKIMTQTINPLKSVDEYKEFKSSLEIYKNKNPQQFALWTASLSDCDRNRLNCILQTVRIEINDNKIGISIPRKIVKIKRNNP